MATERTATEDIFGDLSRYSSEMERLRWEGTFEEYLQKVCENPQLVRSAPKTVSGAISKPGFFETGPNALYGMGKTTDMLTGIFQAAAQGLELKKRIILLMGPVGGGKSTLVTALKRGIEQYSRTDKGAIYAIADCPMHEEPMHLIPEELRPRFEQQHSIHIEGELCPHCRQAHGGILDNLRNVKVKRIILSEHDRVGIGTFSPSDPKSQDITELVGSVDFAKLGEYGAASDPRAYRFDGELNVANRGVMEFVEMLKADERFLYVLLSLAQEQMIKTGRFANISADEVLIAHTNQAEYDKFVGKKENEALKDRILIVPVPYNLRVSAEEKIYDKLIRQGELTKGAEIAPGKVHISPTTLKVAAMFAVLSRLQQSKNTGIKNIDKMKCYDGEEVNDLTETDKKGLQEEFPNEGMTGISPRYVIDCLSTALIKEGKMCLTPIDALRALKDGLDYHSHTRDLEAEQKKAMENLLAGVRQEFDEMAKREVQKTFVYAYEESARTLVNNYLDNIEAFLQEKKLKDPITQDDVIPDENLMRSVEEKAEVSETGKKEFRTTIMNAVGSIARRGDQFSYKSHPRLRRGVEKKLFADLQDVVKITTSAKTPDAEQLKRINEVAKRLMSENGYCATCANELIKYVGTLLNR